MQYDNSFNNKIVSTKITITEFCLASLETNIKEKYISAYILATKVKNLIFNIYPFSEADTIKVFRGVHLIPCYNRN